MELVGVLPRLEVVLLRHWRRTRLARLRFLHADTGETVTELGSVQGLQGNEKQPREEDLETTWGGEGGDLHALPNEGWCHAEGRGMQLEGWEHHVLPMCARGEREGRPEDGRNVGQETGYGPKRGAKGVR